MTRPCDIYRIKNQEEAFNIIEKQYQGNVDKQKKNWTRKNDKTLEYINSRIKNEICYDTINKLKDENLMCEYKKCDSVKNEVRKFQSILEKYNIEQDTQQKIMNEYFLDLIPAGTKGVIRGNKFNNIITNKDDGFKS